MDAYTEVGGRATQDAQAEVIGTTPWKGDDSREGGGSERLEHVLEVELRRDTHMDVSGRVESGTETEQRPRTKSGTEVESDARLHGRRR